MRAFIERTFLPRPVNPSAGDATVHDRAFHADARRVGGRAADLWGPPAGRYPHDPAIAPHASVQPRGPGPTPPETGHPVHASRGLGGPSEAASRLAQHGLAKCQLSGVRGLHGDARVCGRPPSAPCVGPGCGAGGIHVRRSGPLAVPSFARCGRPDRWGGCGPAHHGGREAAAPRASSMGAARREPRHVLRRPPARGPPSRVATAQSGRLAVGAESALIIRKKHEAGDLAGRLAWTTQSCALRPRPS
jgi:hypothetical protein